MKEIAIFGGTFDPPTLAHEAIVDYCLKLPYIDEVWVMPSGQRADKPDMLANKVRLKALELMIQGSFNDNKRLKISKIEMNLPQPTQTYQTVNELERLYPKVKFWFVFGADSYHQMPTWEHGEELRRKLGLLLIGRQGFDLPNEPNVRTLEADTSTKGISSTSARLAIKAGENVSALLSSPVAEYLKSSQCYN